MTLKESVQDWLDDMVEEDYTEEQVLKDLLHNGCESGMVGSLIYHTDTTAFYQEYRDEINALLSQLLEETGESIHNLLYVWMRNDPLALETHNQNLLAWFGFEETAQQIAEEKGYEV